ncbi:acyl-CoA hydrolase [Rhodococcus sp. ACS1]|jgi:3-aminobutyryl-CoA ammonia-lyase|uniref:3-aminobutyryl-CoA ammonia-lyase n=1 Tax=Rhodococcus koreensis TaxID=99653 RepID=A0A1H4V4L2_9NOCA|nr:MULTISPECIES: hotdog domain-containing protein [Rhodococcus]PBC36855.1 acyl-CoA hydrolase [Rhodococcus sp. ACS1]QSE81393.1 acyl-CoA hydrolase [Rhodococcus koreensis]SEC75856.1 3-aminobutyryl-CoA ammonia-lyase [Rhodococcus koreensis]
MSKAVHRRYVAFSDAHYAGNLVDGAYALKLFGDVGTNLSIELDGHEGLFAGYSSVEFLAAVRGGDVVEAEATLVKKGNRSRTVDFELRVICRVSDDTGSSHVLEPPLVAVRARGTAVIPADETEA